MSTYYGYHEAPSLYSISLQRSCSLDSVHTPHHSTDLPFPSYHTRDITNSSLQQPLQTTAIDLSSLRLQAPLCFPCTGKRYNFTAYFHNPNIFKSPPHELLHFVERAYVLKNRLQTLLVSYVIHPVSERSWQEVVLEIEVWYASVGNLVVDVATKINDEKIIAAIDNVQLWSAEMMGQLKGHVCGIEQLVMPKGRSRELGSDFRKVWESVWVACNYQSTCEHSV